MIPISDKVSSIIDIIGFSLNIFCVVVALYLMFILIKTCKKIIEFINKKLWYKNGKVVLGHIIDGNNLEQIKENLINKMSRNIFI